MVAGGDEGSSPRSRMIVAEMLDTMDLDTVNEVLDDDEFTGVTDRADDVSHGIRPAAVLESLS